LGLVLLVFAAGASVDASVGVAELLLALLRAEACVLRSSAPLASLTMSSYDIWDD